MGNILSEQNYEIEYAQNGLEASEIVASDDFDLILMDVMMPVMNGYEACQRIKKMKFKSEIPLIFITAQTDVDDITKGFECGGVDYISKPFNSSELLARVETHITLKRSKDRLKSINDELEMKVQERTEELRKSNNELKNAKEELEVLDNAKSAFLNIISHEIRTPLNGILGVITLIKDISQDDLGGEMVDALDISCKRLEEFSINALNISDLNTRGFKALKLEQTILSETVNDILSFLQADANSKNLIIKNTADSVSFSADKSQMERCLRILIANAIRHSPDNGKVLITGKKVDDYYVITIKDEGMGFPTLIIKNGVKAFISASHIDGNPGLDLYLCKIIIETHGGSLSLNNDNGAFVRINIPL